MRWRFIQLFWFVFAALICNPCDAQEQVLLGERIYTASCATCHGSDGSGSDEFDGPLEGDLSIAQLSQVIQETMPADDPGLLSSDQARSVATYVYDSFYSKVARERRRPARIQLARLTVRQFRMAVADLVGSFRPSLRWHGGQGLRAQYYRGRKIWDRKELALERIDPQVNFSFGTTAPVQEIDDPHRFSIRWSGSVLAQETGEYEFKLSTEHAARLWINDQRQPLIDAWVRSGDEKEYATNLFLIGSRPYSLRVEFTKAKQGVDDSANQKSKPPPKPASIVLWWCRPGGVFEPIPTTNLSPESSAESFVCSAPFPPDDRSYGWERSTSVSKAWDESTTQAAIETAAYVISHLNELAGTRDDDANRPEKVEAFCRRFAERAFGRPLSEDQQETFIRKQLSQGGDLETAVRRVVLLALKSPRFLFHNIGARAASINDDYAVASRLSFGLWDSIPDEPLWRAAREGLLSSPEQLAEQADRMLQDLRARGKLHSFLLTWLRIDAVQDVSKDDEKFPGFDTAAIAHLRTSLEMLLREVIDSDAADFRQLLLDQEVYLNATLAKLYSDQDKNQLDKPGLDLGFTKVSLDPGKRAGELTHPYMMARFSHSRESSPIHRGVFLARGVLGQTLRPPPEAVTPLAPQLHPDLTTRQRVSLQTKDRNCMSCHGMINPLGFTLEGFDAVGQYREREGDLPIDNRGSYRTRSGQTVNLHGARELAEFLAESPEAHQAFVEQLFHHLVKQPIAAYGPNVLDDLTRSFADAEHNIRSLAIAIMVHSAVLGKPAAESADF